MSEDILAFLIAVAILAGLAIFVPFSNFCNDRCQEFLRTRRERLQSQSVERPAGAREAA